MSALRPVGVPSPARPLVSVIIPTRNRADRLGHALDSVLAQTGAGTYFDMDIVVVDDASSDSTPAVVRQYSSVRYIRLTRRQGAAAARNVGIQESRGQYVAFQDDDDLWLPHKLSTQLAAFAPRADAGLVYSQSLVKFGSRELLSPKPESAKSERVFSALLMECFCGHPPCVLVRREALQKAGYFDQSLGAYEDYDLWLRIAFHYPFLYVPGPVAVYHLKSEGQWLTALVGGSAPDDLRRVTEKALRMLPESRARARVEQEVRLRTEWRIVEDLGWTSDARGTWNRVLAFVETYPDALRYRWLRGGVAMSAHNLAIGADSPLAAVRRLCRQLREAAAEGDAGVRRRVQIRLLLAAVWVAMAGSLAAADERAAAFAAACAIVQDPSKLRLAAVLRIFLRPLTHPRRARPRGSGARSRAEE